MVFLMINFLKVYRVCFGVISLHIFCPMAAADITKDLIQKSVLYPGPKTERKLNDLLRSDYHKHLSTYYLNKKEAGFMAQERFEMALTRAIGDIRVLSQIKETQKRQQLALEAFNNWTAGFKRAQISNMPK